MLRVIVTYKLLPALLMPRAELGFILTNRRKSTSFLTLKIFFNAILSAKISLFRFERIKCVSQQKKMSLTDYSKALFFKD